MKPLAFVLLVLVGSLVFTNIPAPSYADSNLDAFQRIAIQARDNIHIQLSQLTTVPDEINQLYEQGAEETDALIQSVSQQDEDSSKEHFLSAMRIFKSINDKISSLTPIVNEKSPQIDTLQLKSEINRMQKQGDKLKEISINNNVEIDFSKFDQLMQDIRQNLDTGNVDRVINNLDIANQFLLDAHHTLAEEAQKKTVERAKDFTKKQIERLDQVTIANQPQNVTQPLSSMSQSITETINATKTENMNEMIAQLKQLVLNGKIDEAITLIKQIEALQQQNARSQVAINETLHVAQQENVNNLNTTQVTNSTNSTISNQVNSTISNQVNSTISNQVNSTTLPNHDGKNEIHSEKKDRIKITKNSDD